MSQKNWQTAYQTFTDSRFIHCVRSAFAKFRNVEDFTFSLYPARVFPAELGLPQELTNDRDGRMTVMVLVLELVIVENRDLKSVACVYHNGRWSYNLDLEDPYVEEFFYEHLRARSFPVQKWLESTLDFNLGVPLNAATGLPRFN